jgi:methionyl-tRNA formyltransferase
MTGGSAPERAADPGAGASPDPMEPGIRVRTVFLGSGPFAVPILEALADHPRVALVGVVTAPDRPAGRGNILRGTPVALRARSMWAPLLQPTRLRDAESVAEVAALAPELGILADYGQIVPKHVLDLAGHGILGVHPSLLPRHRGATPIQATIRDGDPVAGVTIYRMDEGLDTGPMIAAVDWPLSGTETAPQLEADAARRAAALLGDAIGGYLDGSLRPVPQPESEDPVTRPLKRKNGRLDLTEPAATLERTVRAYRGWPGSFVETGAGRLVVLDAHVADGSDGDVAGTIVDHDGGLAVATGDGRLVLDTVQLAGKRAMTGEDFLRGRPELIGTDAGEAVVRASA